MILYRVLHNINRVISSIAVMSMGTLALNITMPTMFDLKEIARIIIPLYIISIISVYFPTCIRIISITIGVGICLGSSIFSIFGLGTRITHLITRSFAMPKVQFHEEKENNIGMLVSTYV